MGELKGLPNLGPVLEGELARAGITTREQLLSLIHI